MAPFFQGRYATLSGVRRAKRSCERARARFSGIASATPDALIFIDNDGLVTFWNDAATRMFGYTKEEIAANTCSLPSCPSVILILF